MYVQAADEIRHNSRDIAIHFQHQILVLELNVRLMVSPFVQPGETQDALGKAICCGACNVNNFACNLAAAHRYRDTARLDCLIVLMHRLALHLE